MDATQVCPGCQVRLVVRDRVRTEFITCPRCLTAVRNPHRAAAAAPAPAARPVAAGTPVCTVCAEVSPRHASNCPANPERRQQAAWSAPAPDREAGSDSNVTYTLAVMLAGMALLGVLQTFGPTAALFLGAMFASAILSGGREHALGNVAKLIMTLIVLALVIAGLAILAIAIICGGALAGKH